MECSNFRIRVDMCQFYNNARRLSWLFIDTLKYDSIEHVKQSISKHFNITGPFYLLLNNSGYLSLDQCIDILRDGDTITVVAGSELEESMTDCISEDFNDLATIQERYNEMAHRKNALRKAESKSSIDHRNKYEVIRKTSSCKIIVMDEKSNQPQINISCDQNTSKTKNEKAIQCNRIVQYRDAYFHTDFEKYRLVININPCDIIVFKLHYPDGTDSGNMVARVIEHDKRINVVYLEMINCTEEDKNLSDEEIEREIFRKDMFDIRFIQHIRPIRPEIKPKKRPGLH